MTHYAIAALLIQASVCAQPVWPRAYELVQKLQDDDAQVRVDAEKELVELRSIAVPALVDECFVNLFASPQVRRATVRILREWEKRSWTDEGSQAAIDKFLEMVRDPQYSPSRPKPLGNAELAPFHEALCLLYVTPDEAAEYLKSRPGIEVGGKDQNGFYNGVTLTSSWNPEPNDWLYIPNLACEIPGTRYVNGVRHKIFISLAARMETDVFEKCLRSLRGIGKSPFHLEISSQRVTRDALYLLRSYTGMTGMTAASWSNDITDEDWAECISAWPNLLALHVSPTGGREAIKALNTRQRLNGIFLRNPNLTEEDLLPFRDHKSLKIVWGLRAGKFVVYGKEPETGVWQVKKLE